MSRRLFSCIALIFAFNALCAQVFEDVTQSQGIAALNASTMYGTGSSCFDVNEDGWDDLTICIAGGATRLYMNNQGVFQLHAAFENIYDAKTCLWGDYDEDGDNDLFIIKRDGPSQFFVQTDSLVFVNQTSSLNFPFNAANNSFGAALGDYNRDSFLDLYIANYSTAAVGGIKSTFLTNNQNGGFSHSLHGYNRNHFQPAFIDLSRDRYQDIFILNDFRTGSELYTQDIPGVFTDQTPGGSFGLSGALYLDAMSNSWCDYDNDADLDIYIANTPNYGNFLFENNGSNSFTNVADNVGVALDKWSWSALWFDLENDGWNDLIVDERHINLLYTSLFGNHVLRNNQGVFSIDNTTGISGLPYGYFTSSKGDFNNDGLYDLYLGAEMGFQSRVFQNNTVTENNYVKCRLKGRLSNHNGVGTYIDYYLNGEHRVHYTQLGENYLCQNAQNYIFGIGANTQIDSLKLSWISGLVDTYYNIPANTTHLFVEGETMPQIQASKAFLCSNGNDSLQLSIPSWSMHTWSNGSTSNSIWVTVPGVYTVTVGTGYGHTIQLNYEVQMATLDNFTINSTPVLCAGDSTGSIEVINLNTGQVAFNMSNAPSGEYVFPIILFEGCVSEQHAFIEEPFPFTLQVDSITNTCFGYSEGSALVRGIDGTPPYSGFSDFEVLQLSNLFPGNYTDTIIDANGCPSSYSFTIAEIPLPTITANVSSESVLGLGSISLDVVGNYPPYTATWQSGFVGLNYTGLAQGNYNVSISDSLGCTLDTIFTVLFNFVEEASSSNEFIIDWKSGQLRYVGTERLSDVEIFNSTGQLLLSKPTWGKDEIVQLTMSPQIIFISSSKGSFRSKVILR